MRWMCRAGTREDEIRVQRQAMPARWNWPLESPLTLRTAPWPATGPPTPSALAGRTGREAGAARTITLIPYGCTKFRVAMFPVTERAWKTSHSEGREEQRK